MDNVTIIEIAGFQNTVIQVTPFDRLVIRVPESDDETVGIFDETFDETFE